MDINHLNIDVDVVFDAAVADPNADVTRGDFDATV